MGVNFFTNHPFSVEFHSNEYKLEKSDIGKIIVATAIGSLLFLVGGVFAFFAASYYFRSKKIEQLTQESNPQTKKIADLKNRVLPSATQGNFAVSAWTASHESLKSLFVKKCEAEMGAHLSPGQKHTLSLFFEKAISTAEPQDALNDLIASQINQAGGWGEEKAGHIRYHLLPLMPATQSQLALKAQFVSTMDSTMGGKLDYIQTHTLCSLFDQAVETAQPRATLEELINKKTQKNDGWGEQKALHISANLLPLMPQLGAGSQISPAKAIAGKYIHEIGARLVCFYKTGPTEFLGNFALCPNGVKVFGETFKCTEAAFQWRKYYLAAVNNNRQDLLNDPLMRQFFSCDGEKAFQINKQLTNKYPNVFASQWKNGVRDQVMWHVLQAKFQQNPSLFNLLKDTKGAYLLEHNEAKRDDYWSDNSDGSGKNMLGKMLMAIRDGKDGPPPNDSSDQQKVKAYALYANQPGALGYNIF
ncbi:NADAR family protein [Estrella lausannensis]|uniref:Conserved putative membrane protein n=1 Tax=Estrella lausannensis TaxID=483423 RepID=A0A0H5DQS1_9BACT|nr:NADAR family protein [Estrella lausannensis]CRX38458.1 Conserved putative membrane protein [Estrella lausannensis]